jgi:hypothetical protein
LFVWQTVRSPIRIGVKYIGVKGMPVLSVPNDGNF